MRLKLVLAAFSLLLVLSSATSFVGYRYLSLASEYRERNNNHIWQAQQLLDLVRQSPVLRQKEIALATTGLDQAESEAGWCINNLSSLEKTAFRMLGADPALQLCEKDLQHIDNARGVLNQIAASDPSDRSAVSIFTLGLTFASEVEQILADSIAFQPYVSVIEDKLNWIVRVGTGLAGVGLAVVFIILSRDLIRSQRAQSLQTKELRELAAIAERANDSITLADNAGRITWVNPAFERLTGYSLEECCGKRPGEFLQGPATDQSTRQEIGYALRNGRPIKREILNYTRDGEPYWITLGISLLENSAGVQYGFMAISADISKDVAQREALADANQEIAHQSLHDPLTELPNRRALDDALLARVKAQRPTTLVRIDLDHFKYVNDTQGHQAGDHVLKEVARILYSEVGEDDLPARVGGDEFVIVMRDGAGADQAFRLSERLLKRVREPIQYGSKVLQIGGSFGVASTNDGLLSVEELLIGADAALYEAKECGRNRVHVYTDDLHNEIAERRRMAKELKKAISNSEFVPYYQPQFDAETRSLVGVETLVRWHSPDLGLVMPDEFLPVAERLSLVEDIDALIFDKATTQISAIHELGIGIDKLALNVTVQRILDPNVLDAVRSKDLGTLELSFEILESVLVEDQTDRFHFAVDCLREAGVGIEVDDFGSGHASIIGLMHLQPDSMKIDRRLVQNVDQSPVSRGVIESIVNIAKSMDLTVVAEGVETLEQADALTEAGCDVLQGYYFSHPLSGKDLRAFAIDWQRKSAGTAA